VDAVVPRSRFNQYVEQRARHWAARDTRPKGDGISLPPLEAEMAKDRLRYRHLNLDIDRAQRVATLTALGPPTGKPCSLEAVHEAGADYWPLRLFREIDHAILHLRFNEPEIGLITLKTRGDPERVCEVDETLAAHAGDWLVHEILLMMKRTLKRLDLTARTILALIEPGSCFAGSLLELALAADRSYMLDSPADNVCVAVSRLNRGYFPMSNGLCRLQSRFLAEPHRVDEVLSLNCPIPAKEAERLGLVTFALDDLDYEDDVRLAIEERASLSPDALTGMEACLRFAGPETMETKIFGRLSAWQNWIFTRPNATGAQGALTLYGKPCRPVFDWGRT
jgi:benzoyl-CoA-dihydrodiol lyase